MAEITDIRTGLGMDVHAFAPDRKLWICGVRIPHSMGLLGHSDADVALHALSDAILGAAALRDIGYHFPDTDNRNNEGIMDEIGDDIRDGVDDVGDALDGNDNGTRNDDVNNR